MRWAEHVARVKEKENAPRKQFAWPRCYFVLLTILPFTASVAIYIYIPPEDPEVSDDIPPYL